MSDLAITRPGRRFLHICYCCNDADAASKFFVDHLAMRDIMGTPLEPSDGSLLGMEGTIVSAARFVYDHRGPRTSPAIEIQHWDVPKAEGVPSTDPFEVGVKTMGFAVADIDVAADRLLAAGCSLVSRSASPFDPDVAHLLDPIGTPIELVADPALDGDRTLMHHMRITVTDLETSLPFYDMLGFEVVESGDITDGAFVGHSDPLEARFVVLRLPDEPFQVRLIQWLDPVSHGRHYANANHMGIFRAAMSVDDTRASYDALMAAGAVFDRPPREVELHGTTVPDMWITFISDPDGIPYEFVQRDRSAFR